MNWDELDDFDSAATFTIAGADEPTDKASDKVLKGWRYAEQMLPGL